MKKVKILLSSLLLLGVLFAQTPEQYIAAGEINMNAKQFALAEEAFKKAVELDPTFAPGLFKLAMLYLHTGDMENSHKYFRQAIDVDAENTEYRAEFERVNEINTMMNEGNRYLNSGELDAAYESFSKVLAKFPFFANAAYSMGGIKIRQKEYDSAITDFIKALEINPEFANAQTAITTVVKNTFNDGNNLYRRGDLEGALAAYRKVLEYDPVFFQACYQIGTILARMGDVDQAIDYYQQALEIAPTFDKGWFGLGLAYKKIDNIEKALESFQKTIDVNPTYSKAYSGMGEIFLERQQYEQAIDKLQMSISIDPTYAQAMENLGAAYTKLEQWDKAVLELEKAVSFDPKSINAWYNLALSYNKVKDCENAIRCSQKAVEIRANYAPALIELGVAYYCNGKGDRTRALNALERARNDSRWRRIAEYEIDRIKNPDKYEE